MMNSVPGARMVLLTVVLVICTSFPQQLFAHRPIFTDDAATSPETAIQMTDPDVSQVVYREIAQKTPQIWLTFTVGHASRILYFKG